MTDENVAGPRTSGNRPTANVRARRIVIWGAVAAIAAVVLTGSLVYTEQSSFCPTCHEMKPYYQAWQASGHATSASCVDCHVDPGVIAHLAHKPIALKEVWDHFFSNSKFPNYTVDIPNSRCLGCHPKVPNKAGSLFSHSEHAGRAKCKSCHAQTGHTVSLASLAAEGVLKTNATTPTVPGMNPSSISGHIKIVCQECHDQAKMKCSSCHQPPHESRGECSNCHRPGTAFVASHPLDTDCAKCHKAPAKHFGNDCAACHTPGVPFAQATFSHPRNTGEHSYRSFACAKCHPKNYTTAYCTCHPGGRAPAGD